jgi:hypothetical protein
MPSCLFSVVVVDRRATVRPVVAVHHRRTIQYATKDRSIFDHSKANRDFKNPFCTLALGILND